LPQRKKKKRSLLTIKTGASSRHITKLKQSIFAPLDIYGTSLCSAPASV